MSSSTWPCAEQVLEALADLPEAVWEELVDGLLERVGAWVEQRARCVDARELREAGHDHWTKSARKSQLAIRASQPGGDV